MAKFNFPTQIDRDQAIARALMLKPRVEGVYPNRDGYVIDRPNGTTEILVSFHYLDELLQDMDIPEVVVAEPVAEVVAEVVADQVSEPVEDEPTAPAPTETKAERKARRNKAAE